MACNCATTEQINELYRKYGEKKADKKPLSITIRNIFFKIGVGICMIPIVPFLALYVFYKANSDDRKINVMEFFKLKKRGIGANVG